MVQIMRIFKMNYYSKTATVMWKEEKTQYLKQNDKNGTYIIPQKIQGLRKRKNKHIILHLVHNKSLQDIIVETEIREKKMQRLPYLPFKEKTKLISQRKALTGLNRP